MGFPKFSKNKHGSEEMEEASVSQEVHHEEREPETAAVHETVCQDDGTCLSSTASPIVEEPVPPQAETVVQQPRAPLPREKLQLPTSISLTITAISSTLALLLIAYNVFFRRKQRRQRIRWKNDSQRILLKVDDLVQQLEERDEEFDVLEANFKQQTEQSKKVVDELKQESAKALQAKEEECQELKAKLAELQDNYKNAVGKLDKVTSELKRKNEQQQDHDCQMLEQKLYASQLSNTIAERDARIEELIRQNGTHSDRIQEMQQKIKTDALKAEKIINELTSERDDRFSILQQENDAIKTTVMGLLSQTQEKYDADKATLKKEMQRRDDKLVKLQEELWKSNALLKRLQSQYQDQMSQSVRHLITGIQKDAEESKLTSTPERRSSAIDTILEGGAECAELKELQKMLQPSPVSSTAN